MRKWLAAFSFCVFSVVTPLNATILEEGVFDSDKPDASLLVPTNHIRAKLNTFFGFRFLPNPELTNREQLEVVVSHPAMAPNGHTATGWEQILLPGRPNTVIWKFEHEKELLPGLWTIYLLREDQALYAIRFEVVAADAVVPI